MDYTACIAATDTTGPRTCTIHSDHANRCSIDPIEKAGEHSPAFIINSDYSLNYTRAASLSSSVSIYFSAATAAVVPSPTALVICRTS